LEPPFQDIPEKYLIELRKLMREFNLPYIEINIKNKDEGFPLINTVSKIEAVVNSILGDIFLAKMGEGCYLLGSLEEHLDNLLTLSAVLRVKHEKTKLHTIINKILVEDRKRARTPIPKIFEDAFNKDLENNDG
jgi:hypothetical protein